MSAGGTGSTASFARRTSISSRKTGASLLRTEVKWIPLGGMPGELNRIAESDGADELARWAGES